MSQPALAPQVARVFCSFLLPLDAPPTPPLPDNVVIIHFRYAKLAQYKPKSYAKLA